MEQQHPIIPPPDLVYDWARDRELLNDKTPLPEYIATRAAQWGADQELEACCVLLDDWGLEESDLRTARRPKPPSLKEQALKALSNAPGSDHPHPVTVLNAEQHSLIRRALEQLDD